MFDLDRFKADCGAAVGETAAVQAIREIVARAVADPGAVQKVIGEPRRAEVQMLHRSADLTILNVVWGPRMTVMPHNHEMWAVIGIYSGREDNILWRRLPGAVRNRIEAAGAKSNRAVDRSDSCLWRRLLRGAAQRVGSGAADRAAIRRPEGTSVVRGQ